MNAAIAECLQGATMNIGKFFSTVVSCLPEEADEASAELFPASINASVLKWRQMVLGNRDEQQYRRQYLAERVPGTYVTFGLVKYMQDTWGLKLDFAEHYTGSVPSSVPPALKGASIGRHQCPHAASVWMGLLRGEALPYSPRPSEGWTGAALAGMELEGKWWRSVFHNRNVYVELDRDDVSDEAIMVRSYYNSEAADIAHRRYPDSKAARKWVADTVEYTHSMDSLLRGTANLVLAPEESFNTDDTLTGRLLRGNDMLREYNSGELYMRQLERRIHATSSDHRAEMVEKLSEPGTVRKRKPAKDPAVLRMVEGGFMVLAAWAQDTEGIYEFGEALKLV